MAERRPESIVHPSIVGAVLLGVCLAGARLVVAPTHRLLGHTLGESLGHLWTQWLLHRSLWSGKALFGQTDLILGETLWIVPTDWSTRIISEVLGLVVGPVVAFNLTALGLLAFSGVAAAKLSRMLGAGPWPAAVAALLVMWSPGMLGFCADGRVDSMGLGWVGMLAASWLQAMRTPSWKNGMWMGLWGFGVVLCGPNTVFATVMVAVVPSVLAVLLNWQRMRPLAIAAAITGFGAVLVLAVFVGVERNDSGRLNWEHETVQPLIERVDAQQLSQRHQVEFWRGAHQLNHAVPVGSAWHMPDIVQDNPAALQAAQMMTTQAFAPGAWWRVSVIPSVLAVLAVLLCGRRLYGWAVLGVVTLIFGLGYGSSQTLPLSIGAAQYYIAPAVLLERIPGLGNFNNYGLFSTFFGLVLAILSAQCLQRAPLWGLALVAVLWGVETQRGPAPLPLSVVDVQLPAGLEAAMSSDADAAIMVLPISKDINYYLQTIHHRPTVMRFRYGETLADGDPLLADPNGSVNALLRSVRSGNGGADIPRRLRDAGVGTILILPELLPPSTGEVLQGRAQDALGEPTAHGDGWMVYSLASEATDP